MGLMYSDIGDPELAMDEIHIATGITGNDGYPVNVCISSRPISQAMKMNNASFKKIHRDGETTRNDNTVV